MTNPYNDYNGFPRKLGHCIILDNSLIITLLISNSRFSVLEATQHLQKQTAINKKDNVILKTNALKSTLPLTLLAPGDESSLHLPNDHNPKI